jgi:acyl-CoA reductase-like NAD-dependent aldehyde dehydrogenase
MIARNTGDQSSLKVDTKQSGIGTEGSKYGIEEYLHLKRLSIGGVDE